MEKAKKELNLSAWIEHYSNPLYKYAVMRVADKETAKDLVQDTFLSALKSTDTFRNEASEKSWLYSILKNKIIDYYRSKARKSLTYIEKYLGEAHSFFDENGHWDESSLPQSWSIDYSHTMESKEFYEVLEKCKNKLAELQNAVFTLKYLEDKDSDEICKELNISPSNYWVLIHRCKLQIRQCLEKNWFVK